MTTICAAFRASEMISVDARRKWYGRVERQPDPGQNLVLTIDGTIQYIAEKELEQAMDDTKAKPARWSCRIPAPAKSWRWPTVPRSIPMSSTAFRQGSAEEPRGQRRV